MRKGAPLDALLVFFAGTSYGFIVPAVKAAAEIGVHPADFLPLQYLIALAACLGFALAPRFPPLGSHVRQNSACSAHSRV